MSDSDKKPQQQLQNSTVRGFVQSLNEKLEKAGLPLASLPSERKQKSVTKEFQVKFINKRNK